MNKYSHIVIGGGIVGAATAREILRRDPTAHPIVLEKEQGLARHQTGHNSGVIHAGVYYAPGSLKAKLCFAGEKATKQLCREKGIRFEVPGKLVVATGDLELERMAALGKRARENGLEIEDVSAERLRELEPAIAGKGALLVPTTGIVDYAEVTRALAAEVDEKGGTIRRGAEVIGIEEGDAGVTVTLRGGERLHGDRLVACAGLQSDRIAALAGLEVNHRIVTFRGEYYTLPPRLSQITRHLIYPVPDPDLPFLGIHLTRMIDGSVTVGPNAVLGFAREGYGKGSLSPRDVLDMASFGGFWRMAKENLASGVTEFRNSVLKRRYLRECQRYCPQLTLADLGAPGAGIRAQAVMADGTLVHDFLFLESPRSLHVCNAPSPAATSALPIAEMIVDRLEGVAAAA
ncbi:MAG: L-2-hydroxyglutarate oxidase [Candidatus Wenzhouxiangella sp. M2_3B_020]